MTNPAGIITVPALAKINLYLHVTGRRDDGYHLLDSLAVFAGINDLITLAPTPKSAPKSAPESVPESTPNLHLKVEGPFADAVPPGADNLVLRAARRLAEIANLDPDTGAAITLVKRLPAGGGLGGGSADAAATLRGLMRLWRLDPAAIDVASLALELGADVPVCLHGRAAFMGGIGEELTPAPALPAAWLVLVNPGIELATPRVFAARQGPFAGPGRFDHAPADAAELAAVLKTRDNGLTDAARALAPAIGDVLAALEALPGILLARMSGSGATCFGLCADAATASEAVLTLAREHPEWWSQPASLETDIADHAP